MKLATVMCELEPGWRVAGARCRTNISLKGQICATAPLAPPPYRGGQVVVAHSPNFDLEEMSKCGAGRTSGILIPAPDRKSRPTPEQSRELVQSEALP
jgi:hypothetical protein